MADSKEHMAKASDVRSVFGKITNKKIIHKRMENGKYRINGVDANLLKWTNKICSNCNNSKTSQHDKAWEKMSAYMGQNIAGLEAINLEAVYGERCEKDFTNMYLYFLKKFGCYVAESRIDIALTEFGMCILDQKMHNKFYVGIVYTKNWPITKSIRLTDMEVDRDRQGIISAYTTYQIGPWSIVMTYAHPRFCLKQKILGTNKLLLGEKQIKVYQLEI